MTATDSNMNLMNLPLEMIDKILSYLSYDQIAKLRSVNRMFNMICSDKLNKGFLYVNQFHARCLKAVKSKLPRRESERRHHPLARHCDILMAVETRLSMLSMSFSKYIEVHLCCFIPGKVLDEALKVLRIVNSCLTPLPSSGQFPLLPRPHDFLQEYRDVSSMAMEHFDDKILPGIKEKMRLPNPRLYPTGSGKIMNCLLGANKYNCSVMGQKLFQFYRADAATRNVALPHLAQLRRVAVASTSAQASASVPNYANPTAQKKCAGMAMLWKTYRGLQVNQLKFKSVHQTVAKLQRAFKQVTRQMKQENKTLRTQMSQQKAMLKHLRRELRETRAAMNVISKDLNQIKIDHPTRGTKRKRESCDEG